MEIVKNIDFGGAAQKRMSPPNSTRKTLHIDLFSNPYDFKLPKIDSWRPQTVRGRIIIIVCVKTYL